MQPSVGLLLDLDGTLVDTLGFLFEAFRHAVKPFVTRLPSDEEIVATFGPAEPECIARCLQRAESEGWARTPFEEAIDTAVERFFQFYETHPNQVRLFPGLIDIVHQARGKGWRLGIFTGKGRRGAEYTLEHLRLWPHAIDCLVSSDDVARAKPYPDGVLRAMAEMAVEARRLLFVGDAPADIAAGKSAQVVTAAALWGAFDKEATMDAKPDFILHSVQELEALLERLGPVQESFTSAAG